MIVEVLHLMAEAEVVHVINDQDSIIKELMNGDLETGMIQTLTISDENENSEENYYVITSYSKRHMEVVIAYIQYLFFEHCSNRREYFAEEKDIQEVLVNYFYNCRTPSNIPSNLAVDYNINLLHNWNKWIPYYENILSIEIFKREGIENFIRVYLDKKNNANNMVMLQRINNLHFEKTDYRNECCALVQLDDQLLEILLEMDKDKSWITSHLKENNHIDVYPLAVEELGATWWDGKQFARKIIVGYYDRHNTLITLSYPQPAIFKVDYKDYTKVQEEVLRELQKASKEMYGEIKLLDKTELLDRLNESNE